MDVRKMGKPEHSCSLRDDTRRDHPVGGEVIHGSNTVQGRRKRFLIRLFHAWFLVSRPMTLGVRAIVHDAAAGTVLLLRHTYVDGWHLPGGGVEAGETMLLSLQREVGEEGNIVLLSAPRLVSMHLNLQASRRDHVALYLVTDFRQIAPKLPDREIAEAAFFPLDALPPETTPATRRRLAEVFEGVAPDGYW